MSALITEAQRLIRQAHARRLEDMLAGQLRFREAPTPEREYTFAAELGRKWRFDFAWPDRKLAVEVEGATYAGGRHTRGSGYAKDTEKYNTASLMGWRVLRFDAPMVRSGAAAEQVAAVLGASSCNEGTV